MTKKQAEAIVRKATQLGVYAVIIGDGEGEKTVNFGQHSTFPFKDKNAAALFLLAIAVEKRK